MKYILIYNKKTITRTSPKNVHIETSNQDCVFCYRFLKELNEKQYLRGTRPDHHPSLFGAAAKLKPRISTNPFSF